jgi:hypothetical protein
MLAHHKWPASLNAKLSHSSLHIIDQTAATIKAAQGNLPNGVTRHGQIQAATLPRKRLGTNINTPAAKRQKNDYLTHVSDDTKVAKVRPYKHRPDRYHTRETQARCDKSGGVNHDDVRKELGVQGKCHVSRATLS